MNLEKRERKATLVSSILLIPIPIARVPHHPVVVGRYCEKMVLSYLLSVSDRITESSMEPNS
jgi:hypothetical protein